MCFSAAASFSAGAILTGLAVISMKEVSKPSHYPLAGIPLLFGAQQLTEGVLWLSLSNHSWYGYQDITTYLFLVIAQVFWPVLLPVAFILFEKDARRKKLMKIFLGAGIL